MTSVTFVAKGATGFPEGTVEVELDGEGTVRALLDRLAPTPARDLSAGARPANAVSSNLIVMHNGRYISPSKWEDQLLVSGDVVSVMPLVVGG